MISWLFRGLRSRHTLKSFTTFWSFWVFNLLAILPEAQRLCIRWSPSIIIQYFKIVGGHIIVLSIRNTFFWLNFDWVYPYRGVTLINFQQSSIWIVVIMMRVKIPSELFVRSTTLLLSKCWCVLKRGYFYKAIFNFYCFLINLKRLYIFHILFALDL